MKLITGSEVREAPGELEATTLSVTHTSTQAQSCRRNTCCSDVNGQIGASQEVTSRTGSSRRTLSELAVKGRAILLRRRDSDDVARAPEGDEIERDLVRDTMAYLDERARGMPPSRRLSDAWDRFFRFGSSVIRAYIRARGFSAEDRDDCEQEYWAAVVAQLGRSRYETARAGLRTWLSVLARNKCADVIRRRTRRYQVYLNETVSTELSGREAEPPSVYELKEEQALVHKALEALSHLVSACSYQVLLLRSIEELDVSEVAAALGLTLEQVRYRHCRAKRNCGGWSKPPKSNGHWIVR